MIKRLRFSALNVGLGYVAVSLVVLTLFATPLLYAWHNTIEQSRTERLQADARNMADLFARHGPDALATAIESRVGGQLDDAEITILLFTDPALAKLAGNLPAWPREVPVSTGMHAASIDIGKRVVRAVLIHQVLPGGYHLLLGRDVSRFEQLEALFMSALAGAAGMVLLLGVAGGLLVRRTLLSKVHDINQAAAAIIQGNLAHRLPAYGGESELNTLVETENRMLDQIEHLVDGIRNVSNSIAHDLRTPLAELRSRLEELSVTRPRPEQTFAEIDSAIADVDRVMGIFNALLRLAEIDSGTRRSGFVEVDAAAVAGEAAEFYQPVAELQGVALSFASSGPLPLAGDPLLLAQAVGNLIDNALKYAQQRGTITVEASRRADGAVVISVSDDGPGIPDGEKQKVLERFYRGDASRSTPGVGLGLSLVAAVARLHGGALELTDNHPGLRATLILSSPGA
ncbi:sensor histidine kinase [Cupriavidus lacunae]|uniref:histidine kinase n=1 Tax=Cupriavidus lacunae TaxID=2666307 RepID=A0A370NQL7_9BURK|nr:ATP-binding protein [Cupriavidus lacunae]RDK07828.1 sensor histidine kinase [Cupriavidus lacunae]